MPVVAMLAAVSGLTLGVANASAAGKTGGDAHFNSLSYVDYTDPALAYLQSEWQLEAATCVKLVNYPDKPGAAGLVLQPEAADALPTVSKDGKTYTFTVTPGKFKFFPSKTPVTAKTFQFVINRDANAKMNMPAQNYLTEIVGASDELAGKTNSVSGVQVKGNKLIIHLTAPTGDFLSRLALPFFCALPSNTAIDPNGVTQPQMAGPYYYKTVIPNKTIVLAQNPLYHGNRPRNFKSFTINYQQDQAASELQTEKGQIDFAVDSVPASDYAALWAKYGPTSPAGKAGKEQFYVYKSLSTSYYAMNNDRIKDPAVRRAINYAIDRVNIIKQDGAYADSPATQVLPPGMAGYVNLNAYPTSPDYTKAKAQTSAFPSDIQLWTSTRTASGLKAQIVQADLSRLGINVHITQKPRATQIQQEEVRGAAFDITSEGWGADYPDAYTFFNILLDGSSLQPTNNSNVAYYNDPQATAMMNKAAKLGGSARSKAYAALDKYVTVQTAPWAAYATANDVEFWSARVGCHVYNPNTNLANLNALCLR